jgi:hypothetical protein
MKIRVFYGIEPIIETKVENGREFGLHRDRQPDAGWGEMRWTFIDERVKEVELTPELRKILVEDICVSMPDHKVYGKLKEFDLIKD